MSFYVRICVSFALICLFARTFFLGGLFQPLRVSGSSMAESRLGPHYAIDCPSCGHELVCGASKDLFAQRESRHLVCDVCGSAHVKVEAEDLRAGQRLLLDRASFSVRSIRRWETVILRSPDETGLALKRIVGLPGEQIEFHGGDIYINGERANKSFAEQMALSQTLWRSSWFAPEKTFPHAERFWAEHSEESSGWGWDRSSEDQPVLTFSRNEASSNSSEIDWIDWIHRTPFPGSNGSDETPVSNISTYNQTFSPTGRPPQTTCDVMIRATIEGSLAEGEAFYLEARHPRVVFVLQWRPGEPGLRIAQREANQLGRTSYEEVPPPDDWETIPCESASRIELFVSFVDERFLVALDGRSVYHRDLTMPTNPGSGEGVSRPFAFGVLGEDAAFSVSDIRIARDAYYNRSPAPRPASAPDVDRYVLGPNEYFVVGDNPDYSRDSRTWLPDAPIARDAILGAALPFPDFPGIDGDR